MYLKSKLYVENWSSVFKPNHISVIFHIIIWMIGNVKHQCNDKCEINSSFVEIQFLFVVLNILLPLIGARIFLFQGSGSTFARPENHFDILNTFLLRMFYKNYKLLQLIYQTKITYLERVLRRSPDLNLNKKKLWINQRYIENLMNILPKMSHFLWLGKQFTWTEFETCE